MTSDGCTSPVPCKPFLAGMLHRPARRGSSTTAWLGEACDTQMLRNVFEHHGLWQTMCQILLTVCGSIVPRLRCRQRRESLQLLSVIDSWEIRIMPDRRRTGTIAEASCGGECSEVMTTSQRSSCLGECCRYAYIICMCLYLCTYFHTRIYVCFAIDSTLNENTYMHIHIVMLMYTTSKHIHTCLCTNR